MALTFATPSELRDADRLRQSSINNFNAIGAKPSLPSEYTKAIASMAPTGTAGFGALRELPGSPLAQAKGVPSFTNADLTREASTANTMAALKAPTAAIPSQVARVNVEQQQAGAITPPQLPTLPQRVVAAPAPPPAQAPPVMAPAGPVAPDMNAASDALTPFQSLNGLTDTWRRLMENRYFGTGGL